MIKLFFDGQKTYSGKEISSLKEISEKLIIRKKELSKIKTEEIVELLNNFSKEIILDEETRGMEGIAFLSQWLKKSNINKLIKTNFENPQVLDDFVSKEGKLLIAEPKGLVGHWIAGNVPVLGLFSLIQSILVKNANIMRIPEGSIPIILALLNVLSKTRYQGLMGSSLISSTAIVYFPKEEKNYNEELSRLCDSRIIWGGKEAVEAISGLPKKETCEDIIFGPKYSFSIIDSKMMKDSKELEKNVSRLVQDIIFSEQESCTSPQIVFCEGDLDSLLGLAELIKKSFEGLPLKFKKRDLSLFQANKIIKIRGEYAIQKNKRVIASRGNEWTILIDDLFRFEEPINSRTIFLKNCKDLNEITKIITPKIQTIGYAFKDKERLIALSKNLALVGVSRIVPLGQMNYYDSPWDGKLLLTRLVNINSLKLPIEE